MLEELQELYSKSQRGITYPRRQRRSTMHDFAYSTKRCRYFDLFITQYTAASWDGRYCFLIGAETSNGACQGAVGGLPSPSFTYG